MTIEASSANSANSPKSAGNSHKANAADGRSRNKGGASDSAPNGGGFMAILSSLGAQDAPVAGDGAALDGQILNLAVSPADDTAQSNSQFTAAVDPAMLLAQTSVPLSGAVAADTALAADLPSTDLPPADLLAARIGSNLGQGGNGAWSTEPGAKPDVVGEAAAKSGKPQGMGLGVETGVGVEVEPPGRGAGRAAGLKKSDKALGLADPSGANGTTQGSLGASAGGLAVASAAVQKPDARDARFLMALEIHRAIQGSDEVAQAVATTLGRDERRGGDRSSFGGAGSGADGGAANGGSVLSSVPFSAELTGASSDLAPVPDAQMAEQLAEQVSEQVQYWISKDIQNAEMQLDGLGEQAVEVSIRMQGNEAHVVFRTDEDAARAALESAGVQLREMLQREGLVLGGVSVGGSNAERGAGDQERKPRPGQRQTQVAPANLVATEVVRRPHGMTGRALDLFV